MNHTEEPIVTTIDGHGSAIKTPKQLLITVILAFAVPITVIMMLVHLVASETKVGAGSDAATASSIQARIEPVAGLKLVDASAPKVFQTGQQVFETTCTACHTAGVAGAPKFGDKAAWAPFIKAGYAELVKNAIHGIGAMPPKGGNTSLSDFEVERAVVYMTNKSGADFKEPAAPADGKKAAAEPAGAPAPVAAAPAEAKAETPKAPAAPAAVAAATPAAAPAAAGAAVNPVGEKLYKTVCFACHTAGVAGAPKYGNKAEWAPFLATGIDAMVKNAISGIGAMPPRGGSQATDAEIHAAVEYMIQAVK